MGISEVEFLDSDEGDDGEPRAAGAKRTAGQAEADTDTAGASGSANPSGSGPAPQSVSESVGAAPPPSRWYDRYVRLTSPIRIRARLRRPGKPVIALLVVAALAIGAAVYNGVRQDKAADDFSLKLVSASYTLPQDASGVNLSVAVQNTGSTMIDLTGVAVFQSGLVRLTQTGDLAGATESEAGSSTASALGPGTAITPLPMPPDDIELVTVPFRYDCASEASPAPSRTIIITGFSSHGGAHSRQLALPSATTPFDASGKVLRQAVCSQPTPKDDLVVKYGGIGNVLAALSPVRFSYSILLHAPESASVTVDSVSQDNPGISGSADPALPVRVLDGQTILLTVTWRVMSCVIATSVHSADGVQITASTAQTVQTWHASLGAQFTKDVDADITTVCSGG
ncbi:MAG: hypothetical protein ACRDVE_18810 [Actinocrinis sp.]